MQGSMILYVRPDLSDRADKIILPGLPAVGTACAIHGRAVIHGFPLPAQRNSKKEKVLWKSVKAPPWHKRKKKWASRHKSETIIARSGVTQSPFLRLCGSRHTVVQNPFGRWCTDGQNRFYGKARKNKVKKSGRFCPNLPFYLYFCTWRVLWRLRNVQKDDAVDN